MAEPRPYDELSTVRRAPPTEGRGQPRAEAATDL